MKYGLGARTLRRRVCITLCTPDTYKLMLARTHVTDLQYLLSPLMNWVLYCHRYIRLYTAAIKDAAFTYAWCAPARQRLNAP